MTSTEPKVKADGWYNRKEASEALGIAPSTLHSYTEQGFIKAGARRCSTRRYWKGSEILKLWRIIY